MRRRRRFTSVVLAEDQRQGEQGLDQEKTLSGLRMQPAVVSHLMEACGQDMLKDAGKESDRIENEGLADNHYHLLLETPAGNLVAGMKWFQGHYTARFNARHRLRGHLFAGRYKAVLVERQEPAYDRILSDYIHLNPVCAHIVNVENPQLRAYKWSSFPIFCGEGKQPKWLRAADVFFWHHFDWRRPAERRAYGKYLQRRAEESWTEQTGTQSEGGRRIA